MKLFYKLDKFREAKAQQELSVPWDIKDNRRTSIDILQEKDLGLGGPSPEVHGRSGYPGREG